MILLVLGLIVGFMNVSGKESGGFLIAAIALLVAGGVADFLVIQWQGLGVIIESILGNITRFVAPAAVVVAIRTVFALAEE